MLILSIDSAGSGCAVCVWQSGQVLACRREAMERGQDSRLVPLIGEMMDLSGKDFSDLDRIAVTRGPGSFTGLRIALATARGIGLASGKPVIGIDRFSILERQHDQRPLLCVIDSRRSEMFCRLVDAEKKVNEPSLMDSNQIKDLLHERPEIKVAGDGVSLAGLGGLEPCEDEVVTAALLASQAERDDPLYLPRPLYLRAPDVTLCKKP